MYFPTSKYPDPSKLAILRTLKKPLRKIRFIHPSEANHWDPRPNDTEDCRSHQKYLSKHAHFLGPTFSHKNPRKIGQDFRMHPYWN